MFKNNKNKKFLFADVGSLITVYMLTRQANPKSVRTLTHSIITERALFMWKTETSLHPPVPTTKLC